MTDPTRNASSDEFDENYQRSLMNWFEYSMQTEFLFPLPQHLNLPSMNSSSTASFPQMELPYVPGSEWRPSESNHVTEGGASQVEDEAFVHHEVPADRTANHSQLPGYTGVVAPGIISPMHYLLHVMSLPNPTVRNATDVLMRGSTQPIIDSQTECFQYQQLQEESSESKEEEEETEDDQVQSCSICLADFDAGCFVRRLRCRHFFHKHCIDEWLWRNKTCAMCRTDITFRPT